MDVLSIRLACATASMTSTVSLGQGPRSSVMATLGGFPAISRISGTQSTVRNQFRLVLANLWNLSGSKPIRDRWRLNTEGACNFCLGAKVFE